MCNIYENICATLLMLTIDYMCNIYYTKHTRQGNVESRITRGEDFSGYRPVVRPALCQ